jgi:hypothetical protein
LFLQNHPDPIITCPFCKTVLFCDLFRDEPRGGIDFYDICENNNCNSRFVQVTYKNYVVSYNFHVGSFSIYTRYYNMVMDSLGISNIAAYNSYKTKDGITIADWYGNDIVFVSETFYPDFSNIAELEDKIRKLVNFA